MHLYTNSLFLNWCNTGSIVMQDDINPCPAIDASNCLQIAQMFNQNTLLGAAADSCYYVIGAAELNTRPFVPVLLPRCVRIVTQV